MKYVGNPIIIDAFEIIGVDVSSEQKIITVSEGTSVACEHAMFARYTPVPGDFLVVQEDGYMYFTPKHVFERKYTKFEG